jgi:hypothetical protein
MAGENRHFHQRVRVPTEADIRRRGKIERVARAKRTGVERLLQLRIFGFRCFKDRNVEIGIFPEFEKVFVGRQ